MPAMTPHRGQERTSAGVVRVVFLPQFGQKAMRLGRLLVGGGDALHHSGDCEEGDKMLTGGG